jgi:hypothetical protein
MATTRAKLIDWLAELPDNTNIGIEQEHLIVIIDNRAHFFPACIGKNEALLLTRKALDWQCDYAIVRIRLQHKRSGPTCAVNTQPALNPQPSLERMKI